MIPPCPETDKMVAAAKESQPIGQFLDWLSNERQIVLAEWVDGDELVPTAPSIEKLLAEYFEIDLDLVEKERRALLEYLRQPVSDDGS